MNLVGEKVIEISTDKNQTCFRCLFGLARASAPLVATIYWKML